MKTLVISNRAYLSFLSQTSPIVSTSSRLTPLPMCILTSSDLSFLWTFDSWPRQNRSFPAGSTNPSTVTFRKWEWTRNVSPTFDIMVTTWVDLGRCLPGRRIRSRWWYTSHRAFEYSIHSFSVRWHLDYNFRFHIRRPTVSFRHIRNFEVLHFVCPLDAINRCYYEWYSILLLTSFLACGIESSSVSLPLSVWLGKSRLPWPPSISREWFSYKFGKPKSNRLYILFEIFYWFDYQILVRSVRNGMD